VAVDSAGNLVVADLANRRVRLVAAATGTFYGQSMTAGDIYTIAGSGTLGFSGRGGPATQADLGYALAVAVDRSGHVAIADQLNNVVWLVAARTGVSYGQSMTAGDIYVVAGGGTGGLGDGGPATRAVLTDPVGVAASSDGDLVIADYHDNRLRAVS
jgi:hypothetical protein